VSNGSCQEAKTQQDEPDLPVSSVAAERFLPGSAAKNAKSAFLHCVAAGDEADGLCLAAVLKGGRCKRRRVNGNYCRQHAADASSPDKLKTFFGSLQDSFESAADRFERQEAPVFLNLPFVLASLAVLSANYVDQVPTT